MSENEKKSLIAELQEEKNLPLPTHTIIEQIEIFERGIPFLKLYKPCIIGDGIKVISENEQSEFIRIYSNALEEGRVIKFVPASGAATRMFKKQLSVLLIEPEIELIKLKTLAVKGNEDSIATLTFFEKIKHFAFYDELKKATKKNGKNLEELIENGKVADIIKLVAAEEGLNYANLPKGSILFHFYPEGARTAFEEHLVEGMNYAANKDKIVRMHFTISPEHGEGIKKLFKSLTDKYSRENWTFEITFSSQHSSTDTVSVTLENKLFRDEQGKIVFRPGGHGALLKNLNDLKADIILIKNIDNIAQEHLTSETYKYKKILGGYLISLQKKVFNLLRNWNKVASNELLVDKIRNFIKEEFGIDLKQQLVSKSFSEKKKYLFDFLNRPIRVCGMVKKEDHPGGGPFWVIDDSGNISQQIVETGQIDLSDMNQKKILESATHFSPVDFACGVKNYIGENFELQKYSNPDTGLISKKSKDGKELKALELPGLWNGGMYYWLTVFIEVPKITFNPVKEINDLLKPEHQPKNH
jgi:hypothetical protein